MIRNLKLDTAAMVQDEGVRDAVREKAGEIAKAANRATSAPVGITTNEEGSGRDWFVRIGARGAAAYPVEFGHRSTPAKRFFKRTLSRFREG